MLRALMITATNPYPPVSGGQRCSLDEIKVYSRWAQLDLIAVYDVSEPEVAQLMREHLRPYCRWIEPVPLPLKFNRHKMRQAIQFLLAQFGRYPFRAQKLWHPILRQKFKELVSANHYDIVHFNHLATARYNELLDGAHSPLRLCTEANVEWEIFARYAETLANPIKRLTAAREAKRLQRYEVETLNLMDGVVALSERDERLLQQAGVYKPIHIFRRPMEVLSPPLPQWEYTEPMVISLGRLEETRTHGTLWCLREVWRRVRQQIPEARWHIIGADPPPSIREFHGKDGIVVEGFIEDLTPFLRRTRACIIPLFIGGGIRIKILDMLSVGLPCVSTSVGAQGLENEGVWIADDPENFAEGVVELLRNRPRWESMQRAGQTFIRENYAPDAVAKLSEAFVQELMNRRRSNP